MLHFPTRTSTLVLWHRNYRLLCYKLLPNQAVILIPTTVLSLKLLWRRWEFLRCFPNVWCKWPGLLSHALKASLRCNHTWLTLLMTLGDQRLLASSTSRLWQHRRLNAFQSMPWSKSPGRHSHVTIWCLSARATVCVCVSVCKISLREKSQGLRGGKF